MSNQEFMGGPLSVFCIIFIFVWTAVSLFVAWDTEYFSKRSHENGENQQQTARVLYKDEAWKACLKGIHPVWLLFYRIIAFLTLLTFVISTAFSFGLSSFACYAEWTFLLVTFFFGLGSFFSCYGCRLHRDTDSGDKVLPDAEQGTGAACNKNMNNVSGSSDNPGADVREAAGIWGYAFQICYQVCAGAAILNFLVFWIFHYFAGFMIVESTFETVLVYAIYSITPLFLIGESILNCLRFPNFRIAYFFLWILMHIVVRWISPRTFWGRFPAMDFGYSPPTSMSALIVGVPCYSVYAFLIRMKEACFSALFPDSFQCEREESE